MVARPALRDEIAHLLRYLVPLGFAGEVIETVTVPAFRPLSFLSALADRVTAEPEPAAANGMTSKGAGSASNGQAGGDDGPATGRSSKAGARGSRRG